MADEAAEGRSSGERTMITAALLMAMAVTALESTVVSTAMPTIIAQLRGLDIYPWVFSAYLLASTVSTPIYGKLADIFGRKKVLIFGLVLFAIGSMLSGMANSMLQLIAARVIQGLGAGSVGPIVLTMLGDLFTLKERAKVQGLFSAVWGGSSLVGPAIGGYLTVGLSWRWVFFVTVPFAVVTIWLLMRHFHEAIVHHERPRIDWAGAILLTLGTTLLLSVVLNGQKQSMAVGVGLMAISVVLLVLFVFQERRAPDPIVPLDLFTLRPIASAIAGSFLIGCLLFGLDTYIPLYVQGVQGGSAIKAGEMITPLFLAWSISVAIAAKVVVRLGFRTTALVGSLLITTGSVALTIGAEYPASSRILFIAGMSVIGLGMGPTSLSYILGVQHAVSWNRRGVATGAITFVRTLGGALGVGILGATLGYELANRLARGDGAGIDVTAALRPETHALLSSEKLRIVQEALGYSLRDVFIQLTALAVLMVLCSLGLGKHQAQSKPQPAENGEAVVEEAALPVTVEH
ncbi:MDR family MFS transporter [Singulisphaera sp. PoT]|uniref:MDR family MFS transporter n=1 Tax=Singulisphaera sp. PoT TaxID=3411797 RepID=UPI003BF5A415